MIHERVKARLVTPGTVVLMLLMAAGAAAAYLRFSQGLGATTNLSDRHPWGLWVAVDVMSGVALAAGGFTTAALVYIFGREEYHALVRPAVLTGLLGYLFVAVGLVVDLALPWHIVHPIWMWPEQSAMFEVAWCVMLYLTVLALEFAEPVCERFGWTGPERLCRTLSPPFAVLAMAFFVGIMSHSWIWTIAAAVFFACLAGATARGERREEGGEKNADHSSLLPLPSSRLTTGVPLLLIITGVILSTMHQSSLGSLFLLMKHRLHPLWWTPSLPINFLLSAVAVGFAMVIVEATLSARAFGRVVEKQMLAGLGKILAYALWAYLAFRLIDLAVQGNLTGVTSAASPHHLLTGQYVTPSPRHLFALEVVGGVLVPAVMLLFKRVRLNTAALLAAAVLVVFGVVFNRINVAWLAMTPPGQETYVPGVIEIAITISIIAAMVLFFNAAVKIFPVFVREDECS